VRVPPDWLLLTFLRILVRFEIAFPAIGPFMLSGVCNPLLLSFEFKL